MSFKKSFKSLFGNVDYCVLRDFDFDQPNFFNDLDVCSSSNFKNILTRAVLDSNSFQIIADNQYLTQIKYYAKENQATVKIDVFWDVTFRGLKIVTFKSLKRYIYINCGIYWLSDDIGNSIGFIKEVLHNGKLRKDKYVYYEKFLISFNLLSDECVLDQEWLMHSAYKMHKKKPFTLILVYVSLVKYREFWRYVGSKIYEKSNRVFWDRWRR